MKLHTQILVALVAGALLGPVLGGVALAIEPIGRAFIRLLVMIVVPLVFASLAAGTASLGDLRKLGRIGARTVGFYLVTTALAVSAGLLAGVALQPGGRMDEGVKAQMLGEYEADVPPAAAVERAAPGLTDLIFNIIPDNPFRAMADADMLQIIFFAILLGIALTLLGEERRRPVMDLLVGISDAMVVLVRLIMWIAPVGVFALIAAVSARFGYGILLTLLGYVLVTIGTMVVFVAIVYSLVLKVSGIAPLEFFRRYYEVMLFAFSTSSSNATLPINLKVSEERLGVSREVASFVLPLGATVNMNGTAIYQGVSTAFLAQFFGMGLGLPELLTVVITATLASVGAAGVPGIGLITLTIVLRQLGIPLEGIAIILGVERILDMCRTSINVTGDTVCAVWVARQEGELGGLR